MSVSKPIRYIRPKQSFSDWLRQLVERRETLWFFIWKDLKVQYQKPIFGLLWSVFQPLVYFGVVFFVMDKIERDPLQYKMPFSLYLIAGLSAWSFVTVSITRAVSNIQSNGNLISKSSFPRFYLVLSPVLKQSIDLVLALVLVIAFAAVSGYIWDDFGRWMDFLAGFSIIWLTTLAGASIAVSAVVWNRHLRHVIPVLLHALLFIVPVLYPVTIGRSFWSQQFYMIHPLAGAIDSIRAPFGGVSIKHVGFWLFQALIYLFVAVLIFRKTERTLADKV